MTPCSPAEFHKDLEEHVASIFAVEEYAKQETSMKQVDIRASLANCIFLKNTTFWNVIPCSLPKVN
jgi:hypothetical protein